MEDVRGGISSISYLAKYLVSLHLVPPGLVAAATAWVEVGADQGGAELGRRDVQHQGQLLVSRRPAQRRVLAQRAAHLQQ